MFVSSSRSHGTLASGVALATLLALTPPVAAQSNTGTAAKSPFSFELGTGYRYNSRLAVPDLDLKSEQGDSAFLINGGVDADFDLTARTSFSAGYRFSQSRYQDLSAFDIRTHIGSLQLQHDFGNFDGGVSYHHATSDLGGRDYLDYSRLSPYVSVHVSDAVMLRGAYIRTEKDFDQVPDRDSTTQAAGLDAYVFLNGPKTYLTVGYLRENTEARADQFDFDANNYALRLTHNFMLGGWKSRFRTGYRHEQRDYDAITPSIGVVRDDTRNSFDAQLRVLFTDWLYGELEHEVNENSSRLPAADFSQNVTTLSLGMEF